MKLGIFGGSFDPIHLGHLVMAESFASQFLLDKVLFVPSFLTPLKASPKNVDRDDIINLINLSLEGNPKFELENYEILRNELSFTCNTIKFIFEKYKQPIIYLLIGEDQFFQFKQWKNWEEILNLTNLVVAARGLNNLTLEEELTSYKNLGFRVFILEAPLIGISSSKIRNDIANKISIRYRVQENAINYIRHKQIYL